LMIVRCERFREGADKVAGGLGVRPEVVEKVGMLDRECWRKP
jgi:hypothetical protein